MKIKIHFVKEMGKSFIEEKITKIKKKNLEEAVKQLNNEVNRIITSTKNGTSEEIATRKIDTTKLSISYEGKTFIIPPDIHTLKSGKDIHLYIDYDKEKFLYFKEHSAIFNARFLDRLLNNQILGQLVGKLRKSMENPDKSEFLGKIFIYGIVFALGVLIGAYAL